MGEVRDREHAGQRLLHGLVPDSVAERYSELLDRGCVALDRATGAVLAEDLLRLGLAHVDERSGQPVIRPVEPLLALESRLSQLQRELAAQHRALLAGHARLREAQSHFPGAQSPAAAAHLVRVLCDDEETQNVAAGFSSTALQELLSVIRDPDERMPVPGTAGWSRESPVRQRVIYDLRLVQQEQTAASIGDTAAPTECRLMSRVPVELRIVDDTAAMVPLLPTKGAVLLIRSRPLVGALRQYFDMLWQRAIPMRSDPAEQSPLTEVQQTILTLMSYGLKDESIARRTGMSVRSVRRQISTLVELLSAETRFAAGVEAHRRGWL
jgi:DNA-binding CsgD family transcriptional regulator